MCTIESIDFYHLFNYLSSCIISALKTNQSANQFFTVFIPSQNQVLCEGRRLEQQSCINQWTDVRKHVCDLHTLANHSINESWSSPKKWGIPKHRFRVSPYLPIKSLINPLNPPRNSPFMVPLRSRVPLAPLGGSHPCRVPNESLLIHQPMSTNLGLTFQISQKLIIGI